MGKKWSKEEKWSIVAVLTIMGAVSTIIYFDTQNNPRPEVIDVWMPVMEAYSDDGIECHVAVVDRILHISDVLRPSPYVDDMLHPHHATMHARELATIMVLDGEWRPPECE